MQRYFSKEKKSNLFILNDDDIYHIKHVMRMHDGEKIEVVYNKSVYLCCILNVNKNIEIKIEKELEITINKEPKLTLIIPYLKEQKMDLILQKATELGVDEIITIPLERSVIKINDKIDNKLSRWQKILKEASEQSMRVDIPIIKAETIKSLNELNGIKILCSTTTYDNNIRNVLKKYHNCDKINVVIGPEGGFTSKEEEYFESIGFIRTSLGSQILRVETVPIFLLSIIRYEYME